MKAFEGAVEVGAHAIETDIHLSKDDVVVLSHVSCNYVARDNIADRSPGWRSQAVLWPKGEGNRLHLGVSEFTSHAQGASRTYAATF